MTDLLRKLVKASESADPVKRLTVLEAIRLEAQKEQDQVLTELRPSEIAAALNISRAAATYRRQHAEGRLTR